MKITAKWLRDHGACDTDDFERVFPNGAELTLDNLMLWLEKGYSRFDLYWLGAKILGRVREGRVYAKACRACPPRQRFKDWGIDISLLYTLNLAEALAEKGVLTE